MNDPTRSDSLLIVPIYNEILRFNSKRWLYLADNCNFDILFVDDGSTDGTREICQNLAQINSKIYYINLNYNIGKGRSFFKGLDFANNHDYEFVGLTDSDFAVSERDIIQAHTTIKESSELDIVSGARVRLAGWGTRREVVRLWIGRIIASLVALIIDELIYDPQSPCKWIRVKLMSDRSILTTPPVTKWFAEAELIFRLKHYAPNKKLSVYEFPLNSWEDKKGSKLTYSMIFIVFAEIIKLFISTKIKKNN